MVKASGGQRESDGVVVPSIGVKYNTPGGKGPDFGHADRGGTRRGMAGTARSNHPGGRKPVVLHRLPPVGKVQQLQRQLWAAAKQSPERRFHALYDRIFRADVLGEAWRRVRSNRGAAGVDRLTLADIEAYGVERMLDELARDLRAGQYRPAPVRRQEIPKPDGGVRPLGIPTVRDRVAQQAAKLVLEPIFEADFLPASYGFRPLRSATMALEIIRAHYPQGYGWVAEADIRNFFDRIDHAVVLRLVERRVSDRRVLKLVRGWLTAGVMVEGQVQATVAGTPQGGVISPLLANIVLHELDRQWRAQTDGVLVRYADDFVVLCRSADQATAALARAGAILTELGLELHPDKTKVVALGRRSARLRLPGLPLPCPRVGSAPGARHPPLLPPALALGAGAEAVAREGPSQDRPKPLPRRHSRGHRGDQPHPAWLGHLLPDRQRRPRVQCHGWLRPRPAAGLARQALRSAPSGGAVQGVDAGLVRSPRPLSSPGDCPLSRSSVTMSERPSVSRVRENRMHGSKGGWGDGSALRTPRP